MKEFVLNANVKVKVDEDRWGYIYLNDKLINQGKINLRNILDDMILEGYDNKEIDLRNY